MKKLTFMKSQALQMITQLGNIVQSLDESKKYDVEIKEHRERRSLDANAYFWVLCSKLAAHTGIEKDVIYIGNSAGAILVGTDTEWTLESEPYEFDLKKVYGQNALHGYGLIDKLIFVHCTKYRMARGYEKEMYGGKEFRTLDTDCYPAYREDLKKYKKDEFIRIGNNQVYYINGEIRKIISYDWRNIPVKIL